MTQLSPASTANVIRRFISNRVLSRRTRIRMAGERLPIHSESLCQLCEVIVGNLKTHGISTVTTSATTCSKCPSVSS